jgi:hypothetical protein
MNCGEFEALVGDMARGREEFERRAAAAHARECAGCSSRLVEERELAGLLGLFAASVAGRAAPPRVETVLLAAFLSQHALPSAPRRSLAFPRWAFAALAALALVIAAAWLLRPRPVAAPPVVAKGPTLAPVPVPAPVAREAPVVHRAAQPRRQPPADREVAATQFYPLTPVDAGARIQGGTIVRIGMPRTALASFGWPLDPDDSGGAVEAEVVLDGDTGMARAIRFVSSRQ